MPKHREQRGVTALHNAQGGDPNRRGASYFGAPKSPKSPQLSIALHSRPHALANAGLPRDDAPMIRRVRARRNGQTPVEHGLEQRRVDCAHEQDVVGGGGPGEASGEFQVPVRPLRHLPATNRGDEAADVVVVVQRGQVENRGHCKQRGSAGRGAARRALR